MLMMMMTMITSMVAVVMLPAAEMGKAKI